MATARIFIPWAIKTSPFRSGSVTCRSRAVYAEYLVLKFLKLKGCTMSSDSTSSPFHHSKMLILFSFFIKKKSYSSCSLYLRLRISTLVVLDAAKEASGLEEESEGSAFGCASGFGK